MRPTFRGIEIARTGVYISQKQLDVTGHNIANVETEGYSRQRIDTAAIDPMNGTMFLKIMEHGRVGGGVEALTTSQMRDIFLDLQYRHENADLNDWKTRYAALYRTDSLFNGDLTDKGLISVTKKFVDALEAMTGNTETQEQRTNFTQASTALTETFNAYYKELEDILNSENAKLKVNAATVNQIAESIAALNKEIYRYELGGDEKANDLRDKRNLLLDKLSGLGDITYSENNPGGTMQVYFAGHLLVDHTQYDQIQVVPDGELNNTVLQIQQLNERIASAATPADIATLQAKQRELVDQFNTLGLGTLAAVDNGDDTISLTIAKNGNAAAPILDSANATDPATFIQGDLNHVTGAYDMYHLQWMSDPSLEVNVTSGEMHGHKMMRDGDTVDAPGIAYFINQFNQYVNLLANRINEVHRTGWSLAYTKADGTPVLSQTGNDFFQTSDGSSTFTAKNIRLTDWILENPNHIQGSTEEVDGATTPGGSGNKGPGNNEKFKEMLKSIEQKLVNNATVLGSWAGILGEIGVQANKLKNLTGTFESVVSTTQNQRLSVMGVDLGEEMTNMIRFNHAFAASSRVITAMDEALDKLINGTGRVGL